MKCLKSYAWENDDLVQIIQKCKQFSFIYQQFYLRKGGWVKQKSDVSILKETSSGLRFFIDNDYY